MNPASWSQPGIFALGTRAHHHLEFDLTDGADTDRLLAAVRAFRSSLTTVAGINVVTGFAPRLWRRLRPDDCPPDAADFTTMTANGHTYPGTQHDVWIWLHGSTPDGVLDAARLAVATLAPDADLAAEQQGFVYGASQDLTGFEDGTENPDLDDAPAVIRVADGTPGAGSSIALVQRWVHDLDAFGALTTDEAERVVGRTLSGSVELDDMPPRAHVARVVIEDDDGDELEIFRRSVSYGDADEHGLIFVGFSCEQSRLQTMLDRMLGLDDGVTDHLTDFSTATTGSYYVVPPVNAVAT